MDLSRLCGQLLVGGFQGTSLPSEVERTLADGKLGGVILFKRNLTSDVREVRSITGRVHAVAARDVAPPFVCIDQEGGRVARLRAPVIELPPMLALASHVSLDVLREAGRVLGSDLAALGFSSGLAPVLDVHSNAQNPIIGDRAFGETAEQVAERALAFAAGLRDGGVAACGKHFPGHGDTEHDSHVELPVVRHARERLERVELAPFRAAAREGMDAMMTAHVLYPALDPQVPATLSRAIVTDLLRGALGYRGVVFSDDLEMKALSQDVAATSVAAIRAGCDVLLVCSRLDMLAEAHRALVREAERDASFRELCERAAQRFSEMRGRYNHVPLADDALAAHFESPTRRALAAKLAEVPR